MWSPCYSAITDVIFAIQGSEKGLYKGLVYMRMEQEGQGWQLLPKSHCHMAKLMSRVFGHKGKFGSNTLHPLL